MKNAKAQILDKFKVKKLPADKSVDIVKKLAKLKERETLTTKEFEVMKQAILDKM